MWKLKKEYHFEAGHRLMKHQGKCGNLHGHSWVLFVEVVGKESSAGGFNLNDNDMIVDFYDMDEVIKLIVDYYDHKFFMNVEDPINYVLRDIAESMGGKKIRDSIIVMGKDPTSEVIAKMLYEEIQNQIPFNASWKISKVILKETAKSYCEYSEG